MYSSFYNPYSYVSTSSNSFIVLIVAVAIAVCVYVLFLKSKNTYKGFVKWLYNFLKFDNLTIEEILKFVYLVTAIYVTISGFEYFTSNFGLFLGIVIIGNVVLRVMFELMLVQILTYKNTKEINEKLKK